MVIDSFIVIDLSNGILLDLLLEFWVSRISLNQDYISNIICVLSLPRVFSNVILFNYMLLSLFNSVLIRSIPNV